MIEGLTSEAARQKLKTAGYNELPGSTRKNIWRITSEVIREPMFLLLISCGTLYLILGNLEEGIVLLSTIFIIIGITFFQYQKTERALEALKQLASPRALVIRDGREVRVPGREVVPDDIIIVNEGDRITADATLIQCVNLAIDESLLTGESIPVDKDISKDHCALLGGTLVVKGRGIAQVTHTGLDSSMGRIAASLRDVKESPTRFQKEMKVLIRRFAVAGIFISICVVVLFYVTRGHFIQSLLNGLAASMAILPEEFPVVLTVFLALGAWRLSKKNVLTRKPSAIETLGSATVLCSDKTGTITQNKMEVVAVYDKKQIIHKTDYAQRISDVRPLVSIAVHATASDTIDPMEKAIHRLHSTLQSPLETWQLVKEYPLTRELLMMTRVMKSMPDNRTVVCAKGAPEIILNACKISEEERSWHLNSISELAKKGYRVLGIASAVLPEVLPDKQEAFKFSFNGFIALEDPVRPEVPAAIKDCYGAGIRVLMITGDYPATARAIAEEAGIPVEDVISGEDLAALPDELLREKIRHVNVFARVVPEQKLRIVQAFKANGEIVAMTGDGVNDAPALKAADIGVAMGNKGTDVAREAASLVLLDDNFASIVTAIRLGRRIFDNLQKAMSYIVAIHIPIIGLTLIPSLFANIPLFLLPLHIVFMELIIDPVCSVAFESEQEEMNVMARPPRDPANKVFGFRQMAYSMFQGFLLLGIVVMVAWLSRNEGHTEGEIRAIAFSTLIIGNAFLILSNLSKTRSFISVFTEWNMSAISILFAALAILFAVISIPALQHLFSFGFPGYGHFLPALAGASGILILLEIVKLIRRRRAPASSS